MNIHAGPRRPGPVREDFVPASDYTSKEFAELENERLWPRIWQIACREQDIANPGDFYTYDIVDDSIVVVRTEAGQIKAFHNVCPHRGRPLTQECGHTARFHCRFHGWQFDLDGRNVHVVDRQDWGDLLKDEDISLIPVQVGVWGGWVWINMDPDCEAFETALGRLPEFLDPLDIAGLHYHWRKATIVPCNWKTALEAFSEGYHLQQTHRQLMSYVDDYTTSRVYGRHGVFGYWDAPGLPGQPSPRLGRPPRDIREGMAEYMRVMHNQLAGMDSYRLVAPAERLLRDVPEGTDPLIVLAKFQEFAVEDAESQGMKYPQMTPEQWSAAGADWHLFPNIVILVGQMSCFMYRARPNGHDPDSAIWEVTSLMRYAPGDEPKDFAVQWNDDLTDEAFWGKILLQDYENYPHVQRGYKSRGFRGARPNPKQESTITNFHRALHEFIEA